MEIPASVWKRRWALIRIVLVFLASLVCFVASPWGPTNPALASTVVSSAFSLGGAVVLGYLGFATWDDGNHKRALAELQRQRHALRPE